MAPSPNVLNLVAVMCESILVGAYAVLAGLVMFLLIARRRTMPTMHKALFWASIVMFLISVAHLALVVQQIAVVKISLANSRTRVILSIIQFIISDLVLIWRVWVVWGQNHWIALGPLIIMLIAAGLSINTVTHREIRNFFIVAPSALIVANTSICTFLIGGRIWYAHHQVRRIIGGKIYTTGGFPGTVILFIETGALYTAAQLTGLILNHLNSPGIHILLDFEMPLIGILPTLIIVLVHFNLLSCLGKPCSPQLQTIQFGDRIAQLDALGSSTAHSEDIVMGRLKAEIDAVV